ncbi:MAG: ion transporter [Verrucomicrobia bacterium]|nr:ion transporter [Verrucomicrobiota bacterium]
MLRKFRLIAILLLISLLGPTWVFWMAEHGNNPRIETFGDVLWWWFVSSTTVGYGDIAPVTVYGRLAGVVTIVIGVYCYTNFITITADSLHGLTNQHRLGTAQVTARDHVIICEYTAFADELIQALPHYPELARREVVIVTDLVQVQPYPQHHFVRGVPISPAAQRQAAIEFAAFIFVFANIRFVDPDLKTLHTAARVRQLAPKAKIFVELNDPAHELARHLGDNVAILSSREMLGSVMRDRTIDLSAHIARV